MENSLLRKQLIELQRDNENLRKERSRARKNEYRNTGYALILLGSITVAISYFTHDNTTSASIFLFAGLGSTFLGVLSLFLAPEKFVHQEILEKSSLSSLIVINSIIKELQIYSKGIYVLSDDEIRVIVPLKSGFKPKKEIPQRTFHVSNPDDTALVLVPLGYSLLAMAEKEGADWSDIPGALNEVMVNGLELANSIEVKEEDGFIVRINDPVYINLCDTVLRDASGICSIGCSFCSLIACIIVKSTKKNVVIENVEHGKDHIIAKFSLN